MRPPQFLHHPTKIRTSPLFLTDRPSNFRWISVVFLLQKSVCHFLIGSPGEEWRGAEEEYLMIEKPEDKSRNTLLII